MALTPELWKRVKDVVAEALELPPGQREQFVRSACGADPALLDEAISLLQCATPPDHSTRQLIKGRYRIASELARGGFALTYLAFDEGLHGRRVVVKMLSGVQPEPYLQRKFEEEIRALSLLEHPNIITPLDCGRIDDGSLFLVMQFAEGGTLRQMLQQGPLDRNTVSVIVRQLGAALGFAHSRGIIHRDVKPENVIVQKFPDRTVHVRLIDFGISTVGASDHAAATRIVGTLAYMAPEQFRGEVSTKTDIYGLGALAYELLTGKPPFDRNDPPQSLERQRHSAIPPLAKELRVNPQLDKLIASALAFDPNERPSDVSRLADDLADSLAQPAPTQAGSHVSRVRWPFVAAVLVLVCAIPALVLVWKNRPAPEPRAPLQTALLPKPPQEPAPSAAPAELIRIAIEREDGSGAVAPDPNGVLTMKQHDRFRLRVQPQKQGHFYAFAKSLESSDLHVLFPSRTANQGLSLLSPAGSITIPSSTWFSFGAERGTDTLILIWSAAPEPLLDQAEQFANPADKGAVPPGPIARRVDEIMTMPNSLQPIDSAFQLVGNESASGWLKLTHR